MSVPVSPTTSANPTGVAAATSANQTGGSGSPFARLLSLLGGDQGIAIQLAEGQVAANTAFGQGGASPSSTDADADSVLADILSRLEAGQPFDAEMLDQLAETGLVSPALINRLDTLVARSPSPDLALPGKMVTDGGQESPAPTGDRASQPANGTAGTSGTGEAAAQPGTGQGAAPRSASQTGDTANGQPGAAGATAAVIDDASEALLPRAVQTAATETPVVPKPEAVPAEVKAVETDQPALRPDAKPAVEADRRRIGGERPAGFLTSLSEGTIGQGAGSDGQTHARDALTELRAALQRSGNGPATTQTGPAAAADAMLAQDVAASLQDFDLQLGGRTLDALTATGAPKTVTVTSNGTQLPTHQLALTIATEARAGTRRFEIRLDPPEMGRIDIKLESRADGSVRSVMTVERPETFDALNRDARYIERLLQQSGLKLEDGGLQLAMGGGGDDAPSFAGLFGDGGQNQSMAGARITEGEASADEDASILAAATGQSSTGDSGLDIRV